MEISNFNFKNPMVKNTVHFRGPMNGDWRLLMYMCYTLHMTYYFSVLLPAKTMAMLMTSCGDNTAHGSKLRLIFCARIGPLLSSVVLVNMSFKYLHCIN